MSPGPTPEPVPARLEDALRLLRRYKAALDNVVDAIVIIDAVGRLTYTNEAAARLLGEREPGSGRDATQIVHPDDRARVVNDLATLVASGGGGAQVEFRVRTRDGWLWVEATARNRLDDPDVDGIVVSFRDRTHVRALERLARHDPLTGLGNRTLLCEAVNRALAEPPGRGRVAAVLFIDLDRFKLVNDSLGHGAGDELLIAVAERLRASAPEADTIARFGGDEFVVLATDLLDAAQAGALADRVLEGLARPFVRARATLHIGASIGIATTAGATYERAEELLRDADAALYAAKSQRNCWHVFTPDLRDAVRARLELESGLHRAIAQNELVVHYQPVVDAASGRVRDLEALVRWAHPRLGLLHPPAFLPMAVDTGLIEGVGQVVRRTVEDAASRLDDCGWPDVGLALNLAGRELLSPEVVSALQRTGEGIGPGRLTVEIAEDCLGGDFDGVVAAGAALRSRGVRIAVDNFGVGRTSLGQLADVAVDTVKLDRSVVASLDRGRRHHAVVASMVQLLHALGLPVVGTGVETGQQERALRELGCDRLQGHRIGRPAPLDAVLAAGLGRAADCAGAL